MSKRKQVIHVQAKKGRGVKDSPIRLIDQYWSLDGLLLAEVDQCFPLEQNAL